MRRYCLAVALLAGCDKPDPTTNVEAAADAQAPAIDETLTQTDREALAALCIRSTLTVELNGKTDTGVLIDDKNGTRRFGWVAATLAPSPFTKLQAEQVARELELQLKVAETMQSAQKGTCGASIADSAPVVVTFVVEQASGGETPTPGYWVVAGDTRGRTIEFVGDATEAQAQAKALDLAKRATGAHGFAVGSAAGEGDARIPLCPASWCDAVGG